MSACMENWKGDTRAMMILRIMSVCMVSLKGGIRTRTLDIMSVCRELVKGHCYEKNFWYCLYAWRELKKGHLGDKDT